MYHENHTDASRPDFQRPGLAGEPIRNESSSKLHPFVKGSKVRKQHYWDGTSMAGQPIGPVLEVVELVTPANLGVGCMEVGALCVLSDGTDVYGWNLSAA